MFVYQGENMSRLVRRFIEVTTKDGIPHPIIGGDNAPCLHHRLVDGVRCLV